MQKLFFVLVGFGLGAFSAGFTAYAGPKSMKRQKDGKRFQVFSSTDTVGIELLDINEKCWKWTPDPKDGKPLASECNE